MEVLSCVSDAGRTEMILHARDVHHFLETHHVGVFEGVLRFASVREGEVTVKVLSRGEAQLRCRFRSLT